MPDSPHATSVPNSAWRALQYFNLYRFLVAFLFVALVWIIQQLPQPLGESNRLLFSISAHIDLACACLFWFFINLRKPAYNLQVTAQVLFDIFIISLMMYASSGLNSGFGMLLVISVAGGSILSAGKIAILFAAVATLSVIVQELYIKLALLFDTPNYTHVALLGITFFLASILGHVLARRVRESEALARQSAADIEGLAKLNEHIVQRLQFGVIVLDENYNVRLINEAAQRLLGVDDAENQHIERVSPLVAAKLHEWLQYGIENTFLVRSEAEELDVQVSFMHLRPDTHFGILVFLDDMVILRQRAQQMKLSSLGKLAASIAHEIRNPLSAISHAGQLLSESGSIMEEDLQLLRIIMEHSRRMNSIIENVQKISRRQAAIPDRIKIKQWLNDFVESLIKHHQLSAAAIRLVIETGDPDIYMDASQLRQVLSNLCENALRYSKGLPLVEIRCGIREETNRPYLDVIDHGPGIREDILENLFEPFITSELHGSGLGLYISRELCEANQASLSLYANSENGCCFRITFMQYQMQRQPNPA
ncbi:MAG: sensor histidine kinase [Gammaproteobacteria bacterium]